MVKFHFLGTGNAFGHGGMLQSTYLIQGSKNILLEAGPGLLTALHGEQKSIQDLDLVIISHLHPDHYLGLLLMGLEDVYVTKRDTPLPVYGPKGMKEKLYEVSNALYSETETDHILNLYDIKEHGINERIEGDLQNVVVETLYAEHKANARGFIIHIDGYSIGFSGDTAFTPHIFEKILETDLPITEATSFGFEIPNHTSLDELLEFNIPEDKKVYLTHMDNSVRNNISEINPPLYPAYDGLIVDLEE